MAEWKKVVVSGSQAALSTVTVDTNIINSGTVAGSKITGSFTGSFSGDGSNLTGVGGTTNETLTRGNGLSGGNFDGGTARTFAVSSSDGGTTLTINANGVKVADSGIDTNQLADDAVTAAKSSVFADAIDVTANSTVRLVSKNDSGEYTGVTPSGDVTMTQAGEFSIGADKITAAMISDAATGSILATLSGDISSDNAGTTTLASSVGAIGSNSFTGSFSGSFAGDFTIDLEDLTAGNGLSGTAYDGQTARTFSVDVSGSTLEVGTGGVRVNDKGIGTQQLADDAVTIGKIADSATGSIFATVSGDAQIGEDGNLSIANDAVTIDKIADAATGSILSTLSGDVTTTVAGVVTIANDAVNGDKLADSITIADSLTVTNNATVNGDLTVAGTASFQHSTNLAIADKYILLNSGSNSAAGGGFVVQQATQDVGELFGWDNGQGRWAVTSSFDSDSSGNFTGRAYMAAVVTSDISEYQKDGNIRVESGEIYIYTE